MAFGDGVDFLVSGDGHVTVAAIASELIIQGKLMFD